MPRMRRRAHRPTMLARNVSHAPAQQQGRARDVGAQVHKNVTSRQHFTLDQCHVVAVHQGRADVMHEIFQQVHPPLEPLDVALAAGQAVCAGAWPGFTSQAQAARLGLQMLRCLQTA